jgi:thioredoxin-like negative regulator of GroEL
MTELTAQVRAALEKSCGVGRWGRESMLRLDDVAARVAAASKAGREAYYDAAHANLLTWMEDDRYGQRNAEAESDAAFLRALRGEP